MTTTLVLGLLALLPVLRVTRCFSGSWLAALSPAWAAYLIIVWTVVLSWLELTTDLGFLIWLPAAAGMVAFTVAWIEAPDLEDDVPPAAGSGGLGDRVLELVDEADQ